MGKNLTVLLHFWMCWHQMSQTWINTAAGQHQRLSSTAEATENGQLQQWIISSPPQQVWLLLDPSQCQSMQIVLDNVRQSISHGEFIDCTSLNPKIIIVFSKDMANISFPLTVGQILMTARTALIYIKVKVQNTKLKKSSTGHSYHKSQWLSSMNADRQINNRQATDRPDRWQMGRQTW